MPIYISYLHLLSRIISSNITTRLNIYKLNLIVTYRCNFKCKICSIWKERVQDELSLGEYEKLFSKIDVNWIDISGGEIFLREDIKDIFSLIIKTQRKLALLHFPTNGFLSDRIEDSVRYILSSSKAKLLVTVSLDGPEKVHNYIKGVNSWSRSIETYQNLKKIKDSRFNVFFGFTINTFNSDKIQETIKELRKEIADIDYSDLHINVAHASEHYYGNSPLDINTENIKNAVFGYINTRKYRLYNPVDYLEFRYHKYIGEYLRDYKTPLKCRSLINSVFIDPTGNVFPCSIFNKTIGTLKNNNYGLYKMLKSKEAESLRQEIREGRCPQCWTPCEAYQMILASLLKRRVCQA